MVKAAKCQIWKVMLRQFSLARYKYLEISSYFACTNFDKTKGGNNPGVKSFEFRAQLAEDIATTTAVTQRGNKSKQDVSFRWGNWGDFQCKDPRHVTLLTSCLIKRSKENAGGYLHTVCFPVQSFHERYKSGNLSIIRWTSGSQSLPIYLCLYAFTWLPYLSSCRSFSDHTTGFHMQADSKGGMYISQPRWQRDRISLIRNALITHKSDVLNKTGSCVTWRYL